MSPIDLQITYDFICPWCWIGHAHLRRALASSALAVRLRYRPYELNPTMPRTGMDRRDYRSAKFGSWAHSQALDADVAQAGRAAGLDFHHERIARTPNTRLAHRLMLWAQTQGDEAAAQQLYGRVFEAYFAEGQDIGQPEVLQRLAEAAGLDGAAAQALLAGEQGEREVVAAQAQAQRDGVRSVPSLTVGPYIVSGAQPPEVLLEALNRAAAL